MSFSTDCSALEASFRTTEALLRQLLAGLQARRAAWVSARPSLLAPSPELERITQDVAHEESRRDEVLQRLRAALPTPVGADSQALHVNVTRLCAALPAPAARSLRAAADAVQKLAKAVRTEVTLGQRLVRFAQRTGLGLEHGANRRPATPVYDRTARGVRVAGTAGAIVDGRI
ncbi:MAG: hypothetical protein MUC36_11335 [Planctomycetes bacterium]|jgi:hypothetical protein|nr:hypothetical protein [Planctomycetota bacterium]